MKKHRVLIVYVFCLTAFLGNFALGFMAGNIHGHLAADRWWLARPPTHGIEQRQGYTAVIIPKGLGTGALVQCVNIPMG